MIYHPAAEGPENEIDDGADNENRENHDYNNTGVNQITDDNDDDDDDDGGDVAGPTVLAHVNLARAIGKQVYYFNTLSPNNLDNTHIHSISRTAC